MEGSNRSASLRDPQSSLPVGTLSAILVTSTIYLVSVVTYGSVASREYLLSNRLMSAEVSWPATEVVQLGNVLSTLGAGLQVGQSSQHTCIHSYCADDRLCDDSQHLTDWVGLRVVVVCVCVCAGV